MKDLISTSKCLFRSKMVGLVEFQFAELSMIESIKIEGNVNLNVETFVTNNSKTGYKIITHRGNITGEDPEYKLDQPVYANNIIITSPDLKSSLKIKKLEVNGVNCVEERLISKNKDEIKSILMNVSDVTHITRENLSDFNLNNFIYIADECIDDDTLNTIDRVLVVKELCRQTNKHLIMNKNWISECFEDVAQFTCDPLIFDDMDVEIIVEKNANLSTQASHKLRLYNLTSHKLLTQELNPGMLNIMYKRYLKLSKDIQDEIDEIHNSTKDMKDTYSICYSGTNNNNIVKKMLIHYPYSMISRLLTNLIEDSYIDKNNINIHVVTDEIPFIDHMKGLFEKVTHLDLHRYDIDTSSLKIPLGIASKDDFFISVIEKKKEQHQLIPHRKLLMDLTIAGKASRVILAGDKYSDYIKIMGDKKFSEYIDMNYVFINEKF